MERISIDFENFNPATEVVQKFKSKIGYALGKGPSDAAASIKIRKSDGDEYTCSVTVHSMHGHFYINANARDLESLYKDTCLKMVGDFDEWHKDPAGEKFSHR